MKKIAFLLILLFALVQAGPAIASLCKSPTSIMLVDEEKGAEILKTDIKDKKNDFSQQSFSIENSLQIARLAILRSERLHPSPCIETLSPPPNNR